MEREPCKQSEFCPQSGCCRGNLVSVHQINSTICLSWFKWASDTWKQKRPKQGSRPNATLESHIPLGGCYSFNAALPWDLARLLTPWTRAYQGGGESGLEVAF